ncbi:MAG: hypothetical protein POELPBGB_01225 [Bacteroidia bacterium]|nr:hypothetical protein [Bacteroidia bacterium]
MERDDIYEYSLDTHHNEEEGKKVRKKIYQVLGILSAVTIFEVGMGMQFSRVESMQEILKYSFIFLTLVKAGYIVMVFMHLGDERKNLRWVILAPYLVLIGYLIFICLTEAVYAGENRAWDAVVEAFKAVTGSGAAHH